MSCCRCSPRWKAEQPERAVIVDTEPGTFERIFAPVSVWTLVATLPVSMIWGDSIWMVGFVGAVVATSFAFPKRLVEFLHRPEMYKYLKDPVGVMEEQIRIDWTGWSHSKSTLRMIYHLKMIEKYHYILALLVGGHFLIAGSRGDIRFIMGYFLIFGAFTIFCMILMSFSHKTS